jgi:uncharacterized membrane protein YagU involved in acid resistance
VFVALETKQKMISQSFYANEIVLQELYIHINFDLAVTIIHSIECNKYDKLNLHSTKGMVLGVQHAILVS